MVYVSLPKTKAFYLFLFILVSLLFYPLVGHSAVFNVTNEDELREALNIAESNGEDDVINIAAGIYHTLGETFTYESSEDFSLTIEGAGAGLTILDGNEINRVLEINAESDANVFVHISGLTVQNGFHVSIPGDISNPDGAGISAISQNVTIEDCEFIDNSVFRAGRGGGLYASGNSINLSGNLFSGNSAAFSGGGAYLSRGELNISGNQFIGNSTDLGKGGGTSISATNMYLYDNEFYGNVSGDSGGALYGNFDGQEVSNVTLVNNIFAQNTSLRSFYEGVVSILGAEKANVTNNTITLNSSEEKSSALVLEIPHNQGEDVNKTTNIYNNIVIANDIIDGSDILVRVQPFPVPPPPGLPEHVTIDYGNVNLFNNDFAGFELEVGGTCETAADVTCLLELNENDNTSLDPLFVDAEAGDVSLQPDSPCIDAGDPNAPDVPDTDIFGNTRVPPPDMGAVEFIEEAVKGGGGCSIAHTAVTSSLAVFLALPVLILIRRFVKRQRS